MNNSKGTDSLVEKSTVQRAGYLYWTIWIVPVAALLLAGFWIYRSTVGSGEIITIYFQDGAGLRTNQSALRFRGVQAGLVREVSYSDAGDRIAVTVELNRNAGFLARKGSAFWIVEPEINTRGVSGLGAIIAGSYIDSLAGTSDEPTYKFFGLEERPNTDYLGLDLTLTASNISNLQAGSYVKFRGLPVGEVKRMRLSDDSSQVWVEVHINSDYKHLVRSTTKFWTPPGFEFRFSLFGESQFSAPSLSAVLSGVIAFFTPVENRGSAVESGQHFILHNEPDEKWLEEQMNHRESGEKNSQN